jgi:hypothetical protein
MSKMRMKRALCKGLGRGLAVFLLKTGRKRPIMPQNQGIFHSALPQTGHRVMFR